MIHQTTTKLIGLIKDLKIYVHDIPYIITFTVLQKQCGKFLLFHVVGETMVEGY